MGEERLFYAGVGSRETPPEVLARMTRVADRLRVLGWWLRSGGADGADLAFESGAGDQKEIYLPWVGFNGSASFLCRPTDEAFVMASSVHPAWASLKKGARALHARNCHQILGGQLDDPVKFVICYTSDGAECEEETSAATGGTGTAIRLADRQGVPVFNLFHPDALTRLAGWLVGEGKGRG